MSLYNGPPRPGARGGRDQFNWENVKSDKDREFYLGHSVKATTGRWQKGKDVFWYAREKGDDREQAVQDELSLVKEREEELMMEALGIKPKVKRQKVQPQLDQKEMKQLMQGGPEEEAEEAAQQNEADQVKGVGFRSGQIMGSGEAARETMAGVGVSRVQPQQDARPAARQLPAPPHLSSEELHKLRKAQKKELRKQEKQAKKELKKEAKKEKAKKEKAKKKKKRRRSSSPGSSGS